MRIVITSLESQKITRKTQSLFIQNLKTKKKSPYEKKHLSVTLYNYKQASAQLWICHQPKLDEILISISHHVYFLFISIALIHIQHISYIMENFLRNILYLIEFWSLNSIKIALWERKWKFHKWGTRNFPRLSLEMLFIVYYFHNINSKMQFI